MRITLLSLFSFLLCYYRIYITFASAKCLDDQHSLLLQLKTNLKLKTWNRSIACCNWSGVTCDSEGNVIGLDLSMEYISAGFDNSSSLFSLQNLEKLTKIRYLYLDGINITTQGQEWSNVLLPLRDLQVLSMSSCGLSGPLDYSLTKLENLSVIILDGNNFSSPVPETFANFKNLTTLNLTSCGLTGTFPHKIFQIRTLSVIDLSFNYNLHGSFPEFQPSGSLQTLRVSNTSFSGEIPHTIGNLRYLSELDLSNCKFYGTLPNSFSNLTELSYLDLSSNSFTGPVPSFGKAKNLTSKLVLIDLHNNQLRGSMPVFPESVEYLDFSTNKFSAIPQDIGNHLSSTVFLSLSNNNLHGSILHSLCNASSLKVLNLSINKIYGAIPACLMTMFSTIEAINLSKNNLTGYIPDMFPVSCAVRTLNFHGNLLHGPIPKSLSHCSSLKVLDIGSNQFFCGFPCFLKNIPTLSVLILRNNRFHGSIECSHSLGNKPWKMIQIVDIAFNNFNGKLPEKYFTTWERMMHDEEDVVPDFAHIEWVTVYSYYQDSVTVTSKGQEMNLVKILAIFTVIDFSSNHFEGPIPKVLMDFKALHVLNFSNNGLSGEISSSIGNLKQLESLDFSNNSLVGEIPVQLASLSFLSYLNLSFNHLVGEIPTGTQLQSFQASSFEGNDGLYGLPLTKTEDDKEKALNFHLQRACRALSCSMDWNFLSVELGFIFGFGIVIGPLMFWKKWRLSYWKLIDKILCWIFPWMHLEYATDGGKLYTVLRW